MFYGNFFLQKRKLDNPLQEDVTMDDNLNDFIESEREKESCQKIPGAPLSSNIEKFKVGITETKTNLLCDKCGQLFSDQNNLTTCYWCHAIVNSNSSMKVVIFRMLIISLFYLLNFFT